MIKNFAELRKQLEELSSVINSFKSEAVQLRVVELIFKGESEEDESEHDDAESSTSSGQNRKRRRNRPLTKKTAAEGGAQKKVARAGRKGPATILGELIDEGFFRKKRTIGEVLQYTGSQKARIFKASELSGPLGRFVRDKRLKRDKNADGQYEYQKP